MRLKLKKQEHRQRFLEMRAINLRDYERGEKIEIIRKDVEELKKAFQQLPAVDIEIIRKDVEELKKAFQQLPAVDLEGDRGIRRGIIIADRTEDNKKDRD